MCLFVVYCICFLLNKIHSKINSLYVLSQYLDWGISYFLMLQFDYYLGQIADCLKKWGGEIYFVAGGLYAKIKIFNFLTQNGKYKV